MVCDIGADDPKTGEAEADVILVGENGKVVFVVDRVLTELDGEEVDLEVAQEDGGVILIRSGVDLVL